MREQTKDDIDVFKRWEMNSTVTSHLIDKLREHNGVMLVIQFLQASIITVENSTLVIIYVMLGPLQRRKGNYLLLSQSFADLFVGTLVWFELIAFNWAHRQYRNTLQVVYSGMLEYSFTVCVGTLLVNALERYLLITKPLYHKHNISVTRLQRVTILLWVASLIPAMCLVGLMQFDIRESNSGRVIRYSYVFDVFMLAMICTCAIIHWQSLKNARCHTANHTNFERSFVQYGEIATSSLVKVKKDTRLIKLFIVTMVIFVVTYMPIFFGRLVYDVGGLQSLGFFEHTVLINVCHILYKLSAVVNPILGMSVKKDYRDKIRKCFSSSQVTQQEEDEEEDFVVSQIEHSDV